MSDVVKALEACVAAIEEHQLWEGDVANDALEAGKQGRAALASIREEGEAEKAVEITGPDYWRAALGDGPIKLNHFGRDEATHPVRVKEVLAEVEGSRAADVIRAFVWRHVIDFNRAENFAAQLRDRAPSPDAAALAEALEKILPFADDGDEVSLWVRSGEGPSLECVAAVEEAHVALSAYRSGLTEEKVVQDADAARREALAYKNGHDLGYHAGIKAAADRLEQRAAHLDERAGGKISGAGAEARVCADTVMTLSLIALAAEDAS